MKLQYHKIRNIDKTICTCEQKIAYNLAFDCYINYKHIIDEYKVQELQIYKNDIVFEFIGKCMKRLKNSLDFDKKLQKYNIDAIQAALNSGAENYIKAKYHILNSFEEIGKMFPANYL